ncbi:MAG TPA: hypothetical protein VF457_12300 [Burkholderiaceae bacterium]
MRKTDQYDDVITRLVQETLDCCPDNWTHGTLTIDCDGQRINYKLKNEDEDGKAGISDELRALTEEFYFCMADHGDAWTQAVVSFQITDGRVGFDLSFQRP